MGGTVVKVVGKVGTVVKVVGKVGGTVVEVVGGDGLGIVGRRV